MNKKAIAILGFLFVLILGTLGYLIYSRQADTTTPPANTDPNNTGNSTTTNNTGNNNPATPPSIGSFVKLSDQQVVSPALFFGGAGVTYFNGNGEVYLEDFEFDSTGKLGLTQRRSLDYPAKPGLEKVLWPKTGPNFIVQTRTATQTGWSFFDVSKKEYKDYPSQITSVDWMPDGEKIMYIWLENGKANLNISNADTSNWTQVADMWETDDSIHVSPDGLNILYYQTQNTGTTNAINLTTPDGKVWKGLVKDGYNFGVLWSPDSKKFLYGKKDPATGKYGLWYYDLQTEETKDLLVATTVDKALWGQDSRTVYAAVPTTGSASVNSLTTDKFYTIDATYPFQPQVFDPGLLSVDGRDLLLSLDGSKLMFKNAQDQGLYYLVLQ